MSVSFALLLATMTVGFSQGDGEDQEKSKKPAADNAREAAATPLKLTCSAHGAANMTLVLIREAGTGQRNIEIIGTGSSTRWTVTVDGTDVTPPTQTAANPGQVKVRDGDKITWKVTGNSHGVLFPSQAEAEATLEFDLAQGKPLAPRTGVAGFLWGTQSFNATTTLAVATVKATVIEKAAATPLKLTCSAHGAANMTLVLIREAGTGQRNIEIIGTGSSTRWTVTVDGTDVTPPTQTAANPGQVKVRDGDKITWKVTGNSHGVLFPSQAEAEATLEFDLAQGKPLAPRTGVAGFLWGTQSFNATTTLAVATVKTVSVNAATERVGAGAPGQIEYWIQLENHPWDVSPRGVDRIVQDVTDPNKGTRDFHSVDGKINYTIPGTKWLVAGDALILRRYRAPAKPDGSDAWTIPDDRKVNPWDLNERDPRDRDETGNPVTGTSGTIPGATIECSVGQDVVVHYRNMDRRQTALSTHRIHSLHTHGFVFAQESDGAYPLSKLDLSQEITTDNEKMIWSTVPNPDPMKPSIDQFKDPVSGKLFKRGDRVPVGGTFNYTWRTIGWPTTAGVWIYHDHSIADVDNTGLGAIGFVVIHNPNDPNDVSTEAAMAELPPGPDSPHSLIGSPIQHPEADPNGQQILNVPKDAQYLLLFHELDGLTCINGRQFLGNTPTIVAGEATKMRFGVAGMGGANEGFHTFHIHGHRWVIPGPDGNTDAAGGIGGDNPIQNSAMVRAVSQFEDTKVFGPANSFAFTIKEDAGEISFMRAEPALGEWHMHCHVLSHMTTGMMGSLLVARKDQILDLPVGVKNQSMIEMRKRLFERMRELQHRSLLLPNK